MKLNYSYPPLGFLITIIVAISVSSVKAQQPDLVQNQDSIYFTKSPMMDEILVTANRFKDPANLDNIITNSELTTNISGLTKNLQRDFPSMVRLYTPQNIPILTKYTSNSSLTSTIPDSSIGLELREPSAKFPNPDAPVIIHPNYRRQANISLSPLEQSAIVSTDTLKTVGGSLAFSHSGVSPMFEDLISRLQIYNTTYSGYGGLNINLPKSQSEIILHLSDSQNEYGEMLGIEKLEETDRSASIFINSQYDIGDYTLQGGFARQEGQEHRQIIELGQNSEMIDYEVTNEIKAYSFTGALSNNTTEVRANFHDLRRIYTYGAEDSVRLNRWEAIFTHRQELSSAVELTAEARYDFADKEPSISGNLQLHPHPKLGINLNAARLYDAVGSEGLNNLRRSVQVDPHPWDSKYLRLGVNFYEAPSSFNASITRKKVRRGWYGETANTYGWIGRLGANGLFFSTNSNYLSWNVGGVSRSLTLDISEQSSQVLPGPARLEGHASLEAGNGKMKYSISADLFVDRHMRINKNITGNLGTQSFLSLSVSRQMGFIDLETTLSNGLALAGKENRIVAHFTESGDMSYVSAPPIINFSLSFNFY